MLAFIGGCFILVLVFCLLSCLAPGRACRGCFRFFIDILIVAILTRPLLICIKKVGGRRTERRLRRVIRRVRDVRCRRGKRGVFRRCLKGISRGRRWVKFHYASST